MKDLENIYIFDDSILLKGAWTINEFHELEAKLPALNTPNGDDIIINGDAITKIDSSGALLLARMIAHLEVNKQVILKGFSENRIELLNNVKSRLDNLQNSSSREKLSLLENIGKQFYLKINNLLLFLDFLGEVSVVAVKSILKPSRETFKYFFAVVDDAGINAVPIVSLLSFLIGVVLAYQMGIQLKTYGANIYIAYYSGMAMLREFAPLITALIAAGRTSSAFTALIGMMKVNEEIDALSTMGISAYERLIIPRVLGLLLAMPLLTLLADVFGVLGCMVMSKHMLHVEFKDFLLSLQEQLHVEHYLIGIGKAPVFALIISLVGCFQGFRVELSADSVGQNTTRSVVQAIFLIIIADAIFSVIFSWQEV